MRSVLWRMRGRQGLNLIEVIIASVLVTIMYLAIGRLMLSVKRIYKSMVTNVRVQDDVQFAVDHIGFRVMRALEMEKGTYPDGPDTVTYLLLRLDEDWDGTQLTPNAAGSADDVTDDAYIVYAWGVGGEQSLKYRVYDANTTGDPRPGFGAAPDSDLDVLGDDAAVFVEYTLNTAAHNVTYTITGRGRVVGVVVNGNQVFEYITMITGVTSMAKSADG